MELKVAREKLRKDSLELGKARKKLRTGSRKLEKARKKLNLIRELDEAKRSLVDKCEAQLKKPVKARQKLNQYSRKLGKEREEPSRQV